MQAYTINKNSEETESTPLSDSDSETSEDYLSCLEDSNSNPQDDSREAEIQEMGSSIMLSQSFLDGAVSWKTHLRPTG